MRDSTDDAALITMMNRDVPTARDIGSRRTTTSAGTTRNPPPTPRKPVRKPTTTPHTTILTAAPVTTPWRVATAVPAPPCSGGSSALSPRHSIAAAASNVRQANAISSTGWSTFRLTSVPRYAAGTPTAPNAMPVRHSMPPFPDADEGADERGDADDEDPARRGVVRVLAQHVDQRGHGEHATPAAEAADDDPDHDPEHRGDEGRGGHSGALLPAGTHPSQPSGRPH